MDERDLDAPAYRVEPSPDGCQHCESGKLWDVIGHDGVAQGVSFNDEADADEYATALNAAYLAGAARSADAIAALRARAEQAEADAQQTRELFFAAVYQAPGGKLTITRATIEEMPRQLRVQRDDDMIKNVIVFTASTQRQT